MAMTVTTNVGKKDKGKKTKTVEQKGKTTEVQIKPAKPASTTPGSRTYTPADERTGAKSYGPESKTKPTPEFVKEAQAKKQNLAEKDGKKYRAGYTDVKIERSTPATPAIKVKLTGLTTKKEVPVTQAKDSGKRKIKKLKPMSMTYGTVDKNDRGGTKYVKRQRAR